MAKGIGSPEIKSGRMSTTGSVIPGRRQNFFSMATQQVPSTSRPLIAPRPTVRFGRNHTSCDNKTTVFDTQTCER